MKKTIVFLIFLAVIQNLALSAVFNLKQGHYDAVNDIVKYPLADIAITCSNDETIIIWDMKENRIIKTIDLYKGALTALAVSPGGDYFVAGSRTGQAFIYQFNTWKLLASPKLHSAKINALEFSANENVFVSASNDGSITVYDIGAQSIVKGMSMPSKIMSLTMSPDRRVLAAGDDQGSIYLIPTDDYTAYTSYKNQSNWVSGICFSPDNVFIASVDWDFQFGLYSVERKKSIQKMKLPTDRPLNSIAWSSDNVYIAITCSDGKIYIYDAMDLSYLFNLEGHKKAVLKSVFFPDSKTLISVSADASIKTWDLSSSANPQLIKSFSGY